mmetsp:Transcript_58777/g.118058  ORF Transcript_58777/g.118058 Transcript_58777/m.118058 type:complete len:260 (+) Transcript_58777:40-819(+)
MALPLTIFRSRAIAPLRSIRRFADDAGAAEKPKGWWHSAEFWGACGAMAGWGMTGAAIYDASMKGPEVISLNMTSVMIVYSSLFCRWGFIVKPQNLLLASCHASNVVAQMNQMRRAVEFKLANGEVEAVKDMAVKAATIAATTGALIVTGPALQAAIVSANLGPISTVAAAQAGPFTTHFWAPMSKWAISGASFMDLNRPTDQVSLAQYTALTLTGLFFSRYGLLVTPVNYTLTSVNIALFGSSSWHLGRKIKADYIDK